MKRFFQSLAVMFMLAFVVGCANLGVPTPKTFDDKVAVASTSITTVTAGTTALAQAGKISKATAQNVLTASRSASTALTVAQSLQSTDPVAASAQLQMATTILSGLETFLISQGAKP